MPLGSLVIETLTPLEPSRRCFRMIGGVLVERTVKEVLPTLTTNREQAGLLESTSCINLIVRLKP